MKKQRTERQEVISQHSTYTIERLKEVIDEAFQALTGDQQSTARFEIDNETYAYDDGHYPKLFILFDRPETDEEEQKREAQEAEWQAQRDANERATFERLQKKFGK